MGKIRIETCPIDGLFIVEPSVFGDRRGFFMETYNQRDFAEAGLTMQFVQDNQSMSSQGVLRGMHFQKTHPQGKLVRVVRGQVFDVAVDLRERSETFGQWHGVLLSEFCYKCTDFYYPEDEGGVRFDDPAIGIEWPLIPGVEPILSPKDKLLGDLASAKGIFQ